ncbi:MAG: hypothetical protein WC436_01140 [Candidatus Babeliales bacterium]
MKYIRNIKNIKIIKFLAIICAFLSANQSCLAGGGCSKLLCDDTNDEYVFNPVLNAALRKQINADVKNNKRLNLSTTLGAPSMGADCFFAYNRDFLNNNIFFYGDMSHQDPYKAKYIEEIILTGCKYITDISLECISKSCNNLKIIDLVGCENITVTGLLNIIKKCRKLTTIKVSCNLDNIQSVLDYVRNHRRLVIIDMLNPEGYACNLRRTLSSSW